MHPRSGDLAKSELFRRKSHLLSWEDRVRLSYERARAVAHIYGMYILAVSSLYKEV